MQQERDVRMYDIEGATMEATRDGRLLRLLVRTDGGGEWRACVLEASRCSLKPRSHP